jgi:putative SOS response-associated peptidase YedK
MCGRYSQTADLEVLRERFGFTASDVEELKPRYNIAPSQAAPVLVEDGGRRLKLFRWGLIPAWTKDASVGQKLINARAETLAVKPGFRESFRVRRCLVLADGFYEWRVRAGGVKQPVRIALKTRAPFAMAGLWDEWAAPDGGPARTFAIVTTAASSALRDIHERMPAVLGPVESARWLDPKAPAESLSALLRPKAGFEFYPVSPLVNSPRNDSPACLEPAA